MHFFSLSCQWNIIRNVPPPVFSLYLALFLASGNTHSSSQTYAFIFHVLLLGCPFCVCGTVPMWHFPSCSIVNGSWPIPALLFAPYNSVKRILELREHSLGWEISHVTHNRLPLGFLHVSEPRWWWIPPF